MQKTTVPVLVPVTPPPESIPPGTNGNVRPSPEETKEVVKRLAVPFEPKLIAWRVISTSRGQEGLRGQVVPFADPRVYTDRLNELFTPSGWTRTYSVQTVNNVERAVSNKGSCVTGKVLVTCTLTIFGVGTHSGTGEEWADDANAMTSAEAQAFKRACVCFGLGRYLYDLPRSWVALDEHRRIVGQLPKLPNWAVPPQKRSSNGRHCPPNAAPPERRPTPGIPAAQSGPDGRGNGNGRANGRQRGRNRKPVERVVEVRRFEAKVGFSLFRYCVRSLSGVDEPERVKDPETLKAIRDRLRNAEKGVAKLKAAIEAVGYETYAGLVRDMNLASDALDDIPNLATLRRLIQALGQAPTKPDRGSRS